MSLRTQTDGPQAHAHGAAGGAQRQHPLSNRQHIAFIRTDHPEVQVCDRNLRKQLCGQAMRQGLRQRPGEDMVSVAIGSATCESAIVSLVADVVVAIVTDRVTMSLFMCWIHSIRTKSGDS